MKINIENLTYILNNIDTFFILAMFEIELNCNFKYKKAEKLLPLFLHILQNIKTKYKDICFIYNDFFIKCVEEEIKNQLQEIRYKKLKILQEKSK